jgi:hypothetical protein
VPMPVWAKVLAAIKKAARIVNRRFMILCFL